MVTRAISNPDDASPHRLAPRPTRADVNLIARRTTKLGYVVEQAGG
jgi:hypothetical protein